MMSTSTRRSSWARRSVYHPIKRSVSSVEMKQPWMRTGSLLPGGRNSMSPFPSNVSAPFWSRMVRLSTFDATRNAMRQEKFALMRPVMTLHLAHRPLERRRGLLVVGDHGMPQMGKRIVHRELHHLRVDQQHPQLLRRIAV